MVVIASASFRIYLFSPCQGEWGKVIQLRLKNAREILNVFNLEWTSFSHHNINSGNYMQSTIHLKKFPVNVRF